MRVTLHQCERGQLWRAWKVQWFCVLRPCVGLCAVVRVSGKRKQPTVLPRVMTDSLRHPQQGVRAD